MGALIDPFTGTSERRHRRAARRAAEIPPELRFFYDRLRDVVGGRIAGAEVRPFVETPTAPELGLTPLEQELTGMGQQLATTLGVQPLEDAYAAALMLGGGTPRLSLAEIEREVGPLLSPAIQRRIEQERQGRLDIAEDLTGLGAYEGSPLLEARRRLAEATNRDIAEMVTRAILQERALRGEELTRAGSLALQVGAAAPVLARGLASLPRDVQVQEFGLQQAEAEQRAQAVQQVLNLLLGGVGAGTEIFGTQARTLMTGESLAQAQRAAELQFLGQVLSAAAQMAGKGSGAGACWIAAELYGWGTPEFLAARRWLFERWRGPVAATVRWLYQRVGPAVAWAVRRSSLVRAAVKPFFDWAVRRGSED